MKSAPVMLILSLLVAPALRAVPCQEAESLFPDAIFISDCGGDLWAVDPATGDANFMGNFGAFSFDIAFGSDGVFYNTSGGVLFCVDPVAIQARQIGPHNIGFNGLDGVPGGRLRGLGGSLFDVDPETGADVPIGSLGGCGSSAGDVGYHPAEGVLYGVLGCAGGNHLVVIDPLTGRVTADRGPIRDTAGSSLFAVWGLDFHPSGSLYGAQGDLLVEIDPLTARSLRDIPIRSTDPTLPFTGTCGLAAKHGESLLACDAGGPYGSGCRAALIDDAEATEGEPAADWDYAWTSSDPGISFDPATGTLPASPSPRPVPSTVASLPDGTVPCIPVSAPLTLNVTDTRSTTTCETVVVFQDTTPPDLRVPPPVTLECSGPGGTAADDPALLAWLGQAAAADSCGATTLEHDAPAVLPSGCPPGTTTRVTWTATDDCGNDTRSNSTVTIEDTTPPDLSVPPPLTLECTELGGVPADHPAVQDWLARASATDLCGTAAVEHDAPAFFPAGCPPGQPTTVTWTASDECGNRFQGSSTLTVVDTTPPDLVVPLPVTVECSAPGGAPASDPSITDWLARASASDFCHPVSLVDDAPDFFPGGCPPGLATTVTWTATDACGHQALGSSEATVIDTQPPVITRQPALGEDGCGFLWPPNHGYVDIAADDTGLEAFDVCHAVDSALFGRCASSQPENADGIGDGNSLRDCVTDGDLVHLRSERAGSCSPLGRRYEMALDVGDTCGHVTTTESFDACVRHDRSRPRGPHRSPLPGSNQNDTRSGANGSYGTDCGEGCHPTCGPGR